MLKTNLTTILLCLGLAGYMSATDGIYGETPSCRQKAQEIEFVAPFPDYHLSLSPGWPVYSGYFASRVAMSAQTLITATADALCPSQAGFLIRFICVSLEVCVENQAIDVIFRYLNPQQSQLSVLDRLIMLQHLRYRELDWRPYCRAAAAPSNFALWEEDFTKYTFLTNFIFWYAIYAALYNYVWSGKSVTMLPHWGEVGWIPCLRIYEDQEQQQVYSLDHYVGYRDRTFLIGLSAYEDQYSLFCATDRLWTYRGHTVDIEAGIGLKYKSNGGKKLLGLFGLQGTFRLHECCSLDVAVAYKTSGFIEGITASGDGWVFSTGVTVYI